MLPAAVYLLPYISEASPHTDDISNRDIDIEDVDIDDLLRSAEVGHTWYIENIVLVPWKRKFILQGVGISWGIKGKS